MENIYTDDFGVEMLANKAAIMKANSGDVVLDFGDEISMMILLLKGGFKVMMQGLNDDLEEVYSIKPGDYCSINLINGIHQTRSDFRVLAEKNVEFALVPINVVERLAHTNERFRTLFMDDIAYKQRAIMEAINRAFRSTAA